MGCFHSVPKKSKQAQSTTRSGVDARYGAKLEVAVPEFMDAVENAPAPGAEVSGNREGGESKFFDAEGSSGSSSLSLSADEDCVNSAVAEFATSSKHSSDCGDRPVSPDLIVSPNPLSPQTAPAKLPELAGRISRIAPVSDPVPEPAPEAEEFKSASATPLQSYVIPRVSSRSHLLALSEAKLQFLKLQVFTVWRQDILRSKVESQRFKLEEASRASELILSENDRLRQRLQELETAISIVQSIPTSSVATSTTDLPLIPRLPITVTPPPKAEELSAFMTPQSRGAEIPSEFVSPEPAPISIATPGRQKKNWEDCVRPSVRESGVEPRPAFVPSPPAQLSKREKLKAITEDLFKLSESLQTVDLKKKSIVGS